jgi:AraC-like DNA-binding protein
MFKEKTNSIKLIENRFSSTKYNNIANRLKKYIDKNYQDPNISIELLADHIGLSPNYIRTIFKEKQGISLSDYIAEVRFLKAKQMLEYTDYTIKEIAAFVGFYEARYVYISFKKLYGMTAMEYRKKIKLT